MQVASGQTLTLMLFIKDKEGRVINDEQQASASVDFAPNQDLGTKSLISNNNALARDGVIIFNNLIFRIIPAT